MLNSEVMNRPFCRDITKTCECVCATESNAVRSENIEPPRLDRSAWEPCEDCRSCDNCKNNSDYDPDEGIYGECGKCHEYSNFEPRNFCGECGRPLTDTAWEILEKRLEEKTSGKV